MGITTLLSHDQYLIIAKRHPRKIIYIVKCLPFRIDNKMSDVVEIKIFVFENKSRYFLLTTPLAHNLQKYGVIAVKDFVDILGDGLSF